MASNEDMKIFLSETEDLVQTIEDNVLNLEENPDNKKAIQNLYFTFHTLKGMTAMVGLDNLSEFCHNFENLLDKAKEEEVSANKSREIVELMFESLDVLRLVTKQAKAGEIKDIDDRMVKELKEGFEEFQSDYEITFIKTIPNDQIDSLTTNKKNRFYKITIELQSTCVFKKVRLFIIFRALNEIGQIYWSDPEPYLLENGQFDLKLAIYYLTEHDSKKITQVLDEILEIENKSIAPLSSKQFKDVLLEANSKLKKDARREEQVIEQKGIDRVPSTTGSFEDELGRITSVKVNIETLEELMDYFGEVIIIKNQLSQILSSRGDWGVNRYFDSMDKLFLEIQEIIFKLKLVRVESAFRRYRRLVRDVSKETNKNVKFLLEGTDVEIDRKILEQLNSPLIHLLRNAIYHGIETPDIRRSLGKSGMGNLKLKTFRRAGSVIIQIEDDGKGIDYERTRTKAIELGLYTPEEATELSESDLKKVLFTPGFSTLSSADLISGRGMGLAIVAEKIKELGGSLNLASTPGKGTIFSLTVPFSRAILKAQMFKVAGDLYAIPIENINQIYFFSRELVEYVKGEEYYRLGSDLVPIVRLDRYLNISTQMEQEKIEDLILTTDPSIESPEVPKDDEKQERVKSDAESKGKIAIYCNKDEKDSAIFIIDEILQQMDLVIKPFRSKYSSFKEILGVTITGDGSICIVLDVPNIISSITHVFEKLESIDAS